MVSLPVLADVTWRDGLQLHGFLTQGYVLTTGNNFFGESKTGGSLDFRELGLNGSWRVTPRLQLSLQALSRLAGETDDGALRTDYAFLDYRALSNVDAVLGVRLGRILNPLGFYNDTRDVAFLRPSILLPQAVYFDVNRNFALSSDGAQFYAEHHAEFGDFSLQVQAARPRLEDPDLERSIFFGNAPGRLEPQLSWIGRLLYESDDNRLRLALSGVHARTIYDPGHARDPFAAGDFTFDGLILSAQYNARDWDVTAEYARRSTTLDDFGPFLPDLGFTGESWYLQGQYRFNAQWEGVLRYDALYWDKDDRSGKGFVSELPVPVPSHSRFAKDLTVGLRWTVTPAFMVRGEFHYIDGTGWLSELENPGRFETERYWTLFALLVSYRF